MLALPQEIRRLRQHWLPTLRLAYCLAAAMGFCAQNKLFNNETARPSRAEDEICLSRLDTSTASASLTRAVVEEFAEMVRHSKHIVSALGLFFECCVALDRNVLPEKISVSAAATSVLQSLPTVAHFHSRRWLK